MSDLREAFLERRLSDATLAERCEEMGLRINRVEADVAVAIDVGADEVESIASVTGYSRGQVEHALGVLRAQGLAERA